MIERVFLKNGKQCLISSELEEIHTLRSLVCIEILEGNFKKAEKTFDALKIIMSKGE